MNTVLNISTSASRSAPSVIYSPASPSRPMECATPQGRSSGRYAQQDIARHAEIVRAALAAGVIKHDAEIRLGGAREPLFDLLPRRQPVAQTDDGKVVRERRAEQRAAAARGGEAGDDLDLGLRLPRRAAHRAAPPCRKCRCRRSRSSQRSFRRAPFRAPFRQRSTSLQSSA